MLAFWALGAYNRLIELRNAAAEAWAQADETLGRRARSLDALLQVLREPLAAERGALEALQAAHEQQVQATAAMTARPLRADHAAQWLEAEARLAASAARVMALLDHAGVLAAEAPVADALAAWHDARQRLPYTRQLFNDAAARHDEALRAFPTSLLVRLYGFAPAGRV